MFACLFFGDSLALGTSLAVNEHLRAACEVRAAQGVTSAAMRKWATHSGHRYDTMILSVGSNDAIGSSDRTRQRVTAILSLMRSRIVSARVIWLLPYERSRAQIVRGVAATFGDEILDQARFPSRDGLHPANYHRVAAALLR